MHRYGGISLCSLLLLSNNKIRNVLNHLCECARAALSPLANLQNLLTTASKVHSRQVPSVQHFVYTCANAASGCVDDDCVDGSSDD